MALRNACNRMLRSLPALALIELWGTVSTGREQASVRVRIETELGRMETDIDTARAPIKAANSLHYVDGGYLPGAVSTAP